MAEKCLDPSITQWISEHVASDFADRYDCEPL